MHEITEALALFPDDQKQSAVLAALHLMGSDSIVDHVEKKCGVKLGESTPDGRIYLKVEEECLAACAGGPMMQVDHVYYTNLTTDKVDEILDALD